jgi:hypothetical protein
VGDLPFGPVSPIPTSATTTTIDHGAPFDDVDQRGLASENPSSMNKRALALVLTIAISSVPRGASAQASAPSDTERTEAAERFDRGLRLFNGGDSAGALAEFRRAYQIIPNVLVLYNMGLVYAQMARAVEATEALDRVLASPGTLTPERLVIAKRTRDEQAARIAEITVVVGVDAAAIEIDGVERGKTPLAAPLRVTSGTHVVGAVASGFVPIRKEVTIASGEKQSLQLDLVPMQGRLAHVAIKTHLPGADVFVDDQKVGTAPLAASVSLAPGTHRIDLRRTGYVTARTEVALSDGATGEVVLDPDEDVAAVTSLGGRLALDIGETQAVVTIDGRPRGLYVVPLRLAPGPHHVLVERGNFEPFERDISVPSGTTVSLRVDLDPTPEFRARYVSHAQAQRTWGLIGMIGGAIVAGGAAGLVAYDSKQRSDGQATIRQLDSQSAHGSGEVCDAGQVFSTYQQNCLDPLAVANGQVSGANTRDYFGWSGVGVGAAALVLGVVLFVTADPHAYDGPGRQAGLMPTFWAARSGGGFGQSFVW